MFHGKKRSGGGMLSANIEQIMQQNSAVLGSIPKAIYQQITRAGKNGITFAELLKKSMNAISSANMEAILDDLLSKDLIKRTQPEGSIKATVAGMWRSCKIIMTEYFNIAGGSDTLSHYPWVDNGVFNQSKATELLDAAKHYLEEKSQVPRDNMLKYLQTKTAGLTQIKPDDTTVLVRALVHGGAAREFYTSEIEPEKMLKTKTPVPKDNYECAVYENCQTLESYRSGRAASITEISGYQSVLASASPCMRCPMLLKCSTDGVINPVDCEYIDNWLKGF